MFDSSGLPATLSPKTSRYSLLNQTSQNCAWREENCSGNLADYYYSRDNTCKLKFWKSTVTEFRFEKANAKKGNLFLTLKHCNKFIFSQNLEKHFYDVKLTEKFIKPKTKSYSFSKFSKLIANFLQNFCKTFWDSVCSIFVAKLKKFYWIWRNKWNFVSSVLKKIKEFPKQFFEDFAPFLAFRIFLAKFLRNFDHVWF